MNNRKLEQAYLSHLEGLKAEEHRLKRKSRIFLYGKLLFFFLAVIQAYYGYVDDSGMKYGMSLGSFFLYLLVLVLDERCVGRIRRNRAVQKVYNGELSALHEDFSSFDGGAEFVNPQHEYAYDLDLFGEHSLFQRMNRTVTAVGKKRLADKFQHLSERRQEISEYQEAIHELSELSDWRFSFLSCPFVENGSSQIDGLLKKEKYGTLILNSVFPFLIVASTLIIFLLSICTVLPWSYFFLMFAVQIGITFSIGRLSSKIGRRTELLHKEFKGYLFLLESIESACYHSRLLNRLKEHLFADKNSLKALRRLSVILNLFNQRSNEIMYVVLNGMFLFDVFLIRLYSRWAESYMDKVEGWLNDIAEIDALVSLGDYAHNHPQNTYATLMEEESDIVVQAEGIYHPFLRYEKAVPNDFVLRRSGVSIVTGANMAGKSTFLRTIGVSFVMASNGIPVCATAFSFSVVSLFSSMRTADDLSKDISYFNAELLRLQQLVRYVKQKPFTLLILDEILKGTNSCDKLKGSVMFLEDITKCPVSVMVATHDLELSKLEEKRPDVFQNYCFEIDLSDQVTYTYKIQRGVAKNLNASYLLANILKEIG